MDEEISVVAAGGLVSTAVLFTLFKALVEKGVLTSDEGVEILESALHLLEELQGSAPLTASSFELAREMIETRIVSQRRNRPSST